MAASFCAAAPQGRADGVSVSFSFGQPERYPSRYGRCDNRRSSYSRYNDYRHHDYGRHSRDVWYQSSPTFIIPSSNGAYFRGNRQAYQNGYEDGYRDGYYTGNGVTVVRRVYR